ncbi:integral membrane protein [Colletotrichum fioriniae PJ7]|uniref:Integral membrane protein n=1 Tax=Colletotrichum fioriniae PJ7 TaxID=1445577 RepID=A0A010QG91_9PEZI|nr:integral membrane protein [Colletotrichum fioriniae PJ7]
MFSLNLDSSLLGSDLPLRITLCVLHFVFGSIFFDIVHWLAHKSHRSRFRVLRLLAKAHSIHHQYFDRNLRFHERFRHRNIVRHLSLEVSCQMIGSTMSWLLSPLFMRKASLSQFHDLVAILFVQAGRAAVVAWNSGNDSNHIPYPRLPKDPSTFFVGPEYHALHHIEPLAYFGSMVRLLDWFLGTGVSLRGRRVTMTGSRGALGQALMKQLHLQGVRCIHTPKFGVDWTYDDYSYFESILADTDILVLAHGSKNNDNPHEANCKSAVTVIDLFKKLCERRKLGLLPEVWYIGSEAELHGAWTKDMEDYTQSKRAFVPHARRYYGDEFFNYRHIVPAAFTSRMGSGFMSADSAAKVALWWIRTGARYVPVTYTGFAYLNFFRFRLGGFAIGWKKNSTRGASEILRIIDGGRAKLWR